MAYSGQAVFGGTTDPVTGSWTNATALNSTVVSSDITGYGVVVASFVTTGTITQGTAIFEVSDDGGTTWWPIAGLQTGNSSQATSYPLTSGSASFEFATGAYNLFRVRLNPVILGSGSVAIRLSAEAFPFTTALAVAGTVSVTTVSGSNVVRLQDGTGNSITSTSSALDVNIKSGSSSGTQYTGSPAVAAGSVVSNLMSGYDGANIRPVLASTTGQIHVIADSGSTTAVTGTVAVTQSTSPWVVSLTSTTITGTVAVTQSTSPWTIQGDSASGAANAGNPVKIGGAFNTTQPTVTTGQTVDAQMTARGAQIVATGVDTFNVTVNTALPAGTNVIGHVITDSGSTTVVTGTVAVTQSTSPWVVSLASTTITGTVAVTQSTTPWTIQGDSASGAAKAGNPVQIGGVFNTTQPTVTTGQTVEAQSTARGALIVATGTDAFAVNATQAGTWNIGTVTAVTSITNTVTVSGTVTANQGGAPWTQNLIQVASTTLGTPQTFGTAPTGVVIGTSSDIYVAGTRARSNQTTTAAGVVDVNIVGSLGVTNSVTNGTFMAITDNTTKAGVIAATTALKTDWSSEAGTAITTVPVAFGSGTPSGNAPGVNSAMFVGTTAVRSNQATTATGVIDDNLVGIKGTTVVTVAAGVLEVGVVGNTGAAFDTPSSQNQAMPANMLITGAEYNTSPAAITSGNASPLQLDQGANVLCFPGIQFKAGTAWSSATALNTLQFSTGTSTAGQLIGSAPAIVVQLNQTTTLTGGAVTFQGTFDNVNWVSIPVAQILDPNTFAQQTNPYTFVASTNKTFMILTDGYVNVRANLTTVITGTGTVTPFWAALPYNPVQFVTVSPNSASFPVTSSPAATSNTSVATWTSATALNTAVTIVNGSFQYQSLLLTLNQGSTITGGQVTFEVSNDNANWNAIAGVSANQFGTFGENGLFFLVQSAYSSGIFNTTTWQYFRVRLSTVITGTGNVVIGYAAQAGGSPPIVSREPKDFGRTFVSFSIDDVACPAAEALMTFTVNKGGTTSSGTSYTVTNGKTLRLQSVAAALRSTSGTQPVKVRLRGAASVTATSPLLWATLLSATTTTFDHAEQSYPDGLEIASGQQLGISSVDINGGTTGNLTLTFTGYEY